MIPTDSQHINYQDYYYPFLNYGNLYPFYHPMFFDYPPPSSAPPSRPTSPQTIKVQPQKQPIVLKVESEHIVPNNKGGGALDTDSNSECKTSKDSGALCKNPKNMKSENKTRGQVRLDFRIEWKNENRNIVPNLINQMISFLLKKIKSYKIVRRIFANVPHDSRWTEKKFYLYMKKIKESVTHYVNENVITRFLEIHQPKCELYDYEEQLFYMKVCRVAIVHFLKDDAVLISLTSNRMSQQKREIHLIARDALLRKFAQLCRYAKH